VLRRHIEQIKAVAFAKTPKKQIPKPKKRPNKHPPMKENKGKHNIKTNIDKIKSVTAKMLLVPKSFVFLYEKYVIFC